MKKISISKEWVSILLLVVCELFFFLMASYKISLPGVYYDEVLFENIALGAKTDNFVAKRIFDIPVMAMPYIGALKGHIYSLIFTIFGVSAASIRLPMIFLSMITLWFVYRLTKLITGNLWTSNILTALMASSLCFIISSKLDWGPTTIMMFLMIFTLWSFFRFLDTRRLSYFYAMLIALLLGVYDKSNFIWFVSSLGLSALFFYYKDFFFFVRAKKHCFIVPLIAFIVIISAFIIFLVAPLFQLTNSEYSDIGYFDRIIRILTSINGTITGNSYIDILLNTSGDFFNVINFIAVFVYIPITLIFCSYFIPHLRKRLFSVVGGGHYINTCLFMYLISIILFFEMILTKNSGGAHHVIMLLPYILFTIILGGNITIKLVKNKSQKKIFSMGFAVTIGVIVVFNTSSNIWFLKYFSTKKNNYSTGWDPAIYELSEYIQEEGTTTIFSVDWGLHNQLHAFDPDRNQKKYYDMWPYFNDYYKTAAESKDWYFDHFFNKKEALYISHGRDTRQFGQSLDGFENFQKEYLFDSFEKIHSIKNNHDLEIYQIFKASTSINENILFTGFYGYEQEGVWINRNATITLKNTAATHFSLTGYCPTGAPPNRFTATINNKESASVDMVPGESFNVVLDFENATGDVYIGLFTEKTFIPKNEGLGEDERELGAFITACSSGEFVVVNQERTHLIWNDAKIDLNTYEIISELQIAKDIGTLSQNVKGVGSIGVRDDVVFLTCGNEDPQLYIPLPDAIGKYSGIPFLTITYTNTTPGDLQIFFDYGKGLSEERSSRSTITATNEKTTIQLPIQGWNKENNLTGIRLDPPDNTEFGLVDIKICSL